MNHRSLLLVLVACSSHDDVELATDDEAAVAVAAVAAVPASGIVPTEPESGWTRGRFAVTGQGTAEYDLPLWVPDGRRGFQPSLGLHYNSNAGDGPLGVGWSLAGLSTIVPCSRSRATDTSTTFSPHFNGDDTAYCMDGRRLRPSATVPAPGQREYRAERDEHSRIIAMVSEATPQAQPTSFKVWSADGTIRTYGARMQGFLLSGGPDPENPAFARSPSRVTAAWAVSRIEDRNGNTIDVEYETIEYSALRWAVEFRPKQITYGPDRKVEFVYGVKNTTVDQYRPGTSGGVHTTVRTELTTIKMWTGTQLAREYRIGIGSGSITARAQLKTIHECDGLGVCMVPITFEWSTGYESASKHYDFDASNTGVTDVGDPVSAKSRYVVGDIDGDGRDDLFYQRNDQAADWYMRKSTGTGFAAAQPTGIPNVNLGVGFPIYQPTYRILDYDNDGKMDILVEILSGPSANTKWKLYRSTGTTFAAHSTGYLDDHYVSGGPGTARGAFFTDLDGDGLEDYVAPYRFDDDLKLRWRYRFGTGTGFGPFIDDTYEFGAVNTSRNRAHTVDGVTRIMGADAAENYYTAFQMHEGGVIEFEYPNLPYLKLPENQDRSNLRLADVNGDGIPDAIYPYTGLKVQLGSGTGFSELIPGPTGYVSPAPAADSNDRGIRIVDFNNDGASDVLILHPGTPTGPTDEAHGLQGYRWMNGGFVRIPMYDVTAIPSGQVSTAPVHFGDFNGDGMIDIVKRWVGGELRLMLRKGTVPDKIIRIKGIARNAEGSLEPQIEIDYTTLADRTHHTPCTDAAYPVQCLTRGGSLVARHRLATGLTATPWHEVTHTYAGMRSDLKGRGGLGVDRHTETALGGGLRSVAHYEKNTVTKALASGRYAYPFAGVVTKIVETVTDGRIYERTRTWDYTARTGSVPNTYDVVPASASDSDREAPLLGGFTPMHSASTTFDTHDSFGNVTKMTTTVPGSDRVTRFTYDNDATTWLIAKLRRKVATDCLRPTNLCQVRTTAFEHDPTSGNLKAIETEPDDTGTLYLRTSFGYGTHGNLVSMGQEPADGEQRAIGLSYDTADLYVKTVTNDLSHVVSANVDPGLGVPLDTWDANNVQTTRKFDRFGRLREVNHPDGYFERYTHPSTLETVTTVPVSASKTIERTRQILDKQGRLIEHRRMAFDGTRSSVTRQYDLLGRIHKVSRPFTTGTGVTVFYTTLDHDLRGRLTRVLEPNLATTTYLYTGLRTDVTDPNGNQRFAVERGDGLLASSNDDDPESTGWLSTTYEYRPFGLIGKITAPDGTIDMRQYDRRGRLFDHRDPSTGTTTTFYSAFSEVIQEVNAANESTTFGYDILGRPTTVASPDGTATLTWDPPNHKGSLDSTLSADGVTVAYGYDDVGRVNARTWTVEGTSYRTDTAYDAIGRVDTLTYPAFPGVSSRLRVQYAYTQTGFTSGVADAGTSAALWAVTDRNAAGQVEAEKFGTGATAVTGTRTYYPMTGLLESQRVDGPAGQLDGIHYAYDLNRNVTQRQDQIGTNAKTQDFTYDGLDRLLTWKVSGATGTPVIDTFDYDAIGNLTSEKFSGRTGANVTYQYTDAAHPHQLTSTSLSATPYTYDAAGRQRTGPTRTHTFNRFDLPKTITRAGQTTTFGYDAAGRRVLERTGTRTVITLGELFERRVGTDAKNIHAIVADGRTVAQVTLTQATPTSSTTLRETLYVHADRQGSAIVTTNAAGAVVEEQFYDPFGRRTDRDYLPIAPALHALREGYTGHLHDDELELINMRGRIYDPVARRFLTPDPLFDPFSSQGHNRYSYVRNNPTNLFDPSGFEDEDDPDELDEGGGGATSGGSSGGGGGSAPPGTAIDPRTGETVPVAPEAPAPDEPSPPTGRMSIGPIQQDAPPPPPVPPPQPSSSSSITIPWGAMSPSNMPSMGGGGSGVGSGAMFGSPPDFRTPANLPDIEETFRRCQNPENCKPQPPTPGADIRPRHVIWVLKGAVLVGCAASMGSCAAWGFWAADAIFLLECAIDNCGEDPDEGVAQGGQKFKPGRQAGSERGQAKGNHPEGESGWIKDIEAEREDVAPDKRREGSNNGRSGEVVEDAHHHEKGVGQQNRARDVIDRSPRPPRMPRLPRMRGGR